MFTTKLSRHTLLFAALLSLCSLSFFANASGSFSPSGVNSDHRVFGLGKQVFHKKVICDSCPMAGTRINRNSARSLIDDISSKAEGFENLRRSERKAVIFYLKKRYRPS